MAGRWKKASSIIYLVGSFSGFKSTRAPSHHRSFSALCDQYISVLHKFTEIELKLNENESEDPKRLSSKDMGYMGMKMLFTNKRDLCFQNYLSPKHLCYFSVFAQDIFSKIISISHFKAKQGYHFKFDPSKILIKHKNNDLLDVAIPISQLRKGHYHFKDKVIGPFATMLYDVFSTQYKEILDLLYLTNHDPNWWSDLKDILDHPLFWSTERKITALMVAQIYLSNSSTPITHGLPNVPKRTRKFSFVQFQRALGRNNFYERTYFVDQKYGVKFVVAKKDWSQFFISQYACFNQNYRQKRPFGTGFDRHWKLVTFNRNNVAHYGDENMDGLASQLNLKSVKALVIGLDHTFCFSLMIYHSLRELKHLQEPASVELST